MTRKRILWPTDLSLASTSALDQVSLLSRELDAEVHLLYVAQDMRRFDHIYGDANPEFLAGLQQRERDNAARLMDNICHKRLAGCPYYERHVRVGQPAAEIVALARELAVDYIIMATHGLGQEQLDKRWFGSVTHQVLQASPVPVLVIPPPEQGKP
ncbi:MAG: universal stress protein [Deltaproteobacteria bacterium]|nr:universal stress protein [Deltaproteobacteria bacterium]